MGLRVDGRQFMDNRNISVLFGNKMGCVELNIGNTKVYTRVSSEIIEPKPDRPNEGFLKFK